MASEIRNPMPVSNEKFSHIGDTKENENQKIRQTSLKNRKRSHELFQKSKKTCKPGWRGFRIKMAFGKMRIPTQKRIPKAQVKYGRKRVAILTKNQKLTSSASPESFLEETPPKQYIAEEHPPEGYPPDESPFVNVRSLAVVPPGFDKTQPEAEVVRPIAHKLPAHTTCLQKCVCGRSNCFRKFLFDPNAEGEVRRLQELLLARNNSAAKYKAYFIPPLVSKKINRPQYPNPVDQNTIGSRPECTATATNLQPSIKPNNFPKYLSEFRPIYYPDVPLRRASQSQYFYNSDEVESEPCIKPTPPRLTYLEFQELKRKNGYTKEEKEDAYAVFLQIGTKNKKAPWRDCAYDQTTCYRKEPFGSSRRTDWYAKPTYTCEVPINPYEGRPKLSLEERQRKAYHDEVRLFANRMKENLALVTRCRAVQSHYACKTSVPKFHKVASMMKRCMKRFYIISRLKLDFDSYCSRRPFLPPENATHPLAEKMKKLELKKQQKEQKRLQKKVSTTSVPKPRGNHGPIKYYPSTLRYRR